MPYTHFRYVAYEVPTVTTDHTVVNGPIVSGYPVGDTCDPVADIPVVGYPGFGPKPDWWVRLRRLAAVVDRASRNLGPGDDNATLKVFVAPEFYFRPPAPGVWNSYPYQDMEQIERALAGMFQAARFTHWLIVPGTVMWWIASGNPAPKDKIYHNTVPYVRGGQRTKPLGEIEKYLPSTIDGIPFGSAPKEDPDLEPLYEDYSMLRQRLIDVDGSLVGIEVCLDHQGDWPCQVLRSLLSRHRDLHPGARLAGPALHVLTAGGMFMNPDAVAAKVGGYFLRNDGFVHQYAGQQTELRQVLRYRRPSGASGNPWEPHVDAVLAPDPGNATVVPIPAGPMTVPSLPGPYFFFPQQLRIYPPIQLP